MEKQWYVVHAYSGFEDKVKATLEEKAKAAGLEEKFGRILIPAETVLEMRGKQRKEAEKRFYPGYILVEMELDDETWHLIKSVPRVSGFVGGTEPVPVSEEEISQILVQMERGVPTQVSTKFQTGDQVRITDGAFANFTGQVEDVDTEHGRLRVMVSIFSRQTPVELNFFQVEKT
jgi:transcriptional antiterminator NusG